MRLPEQLHIAIDLLLAGGDLRAIRRAAEELSESYRTERAQAALSTPEHRLAYLVVRLPATYAAVSAVLNQMRTCLGGIRSLLDLGAGPGTAGWAACEMFPGLERVTLVERDPEMVALGKKLSTAHPVLSHAEWIVNDVRSTRFEPHDLVIAAYTLGEPTHGDVRHDVSARAWAAAQKAFAIVEPGTPRGSASLLPLRDALLAQGQHIAAPCPADAECPMKKYFGSDPRVPRDSRDLRTGAFDWCHFAARVERSSLHRLLKSGELGYEDEKFSYLVFVRDPGAPQVPARVLRHPLHGKGHIKLTLCDAPATREITITRSDREAFRAARRARWGDPWPLTKAEKDR